MDSLVDLISLPDFCDEDQKRRIKVGPNVVLLMPERNMSVPVALEISEMVPTDGFESWDHVAEASLELPSGKLVIEECSSNC